MATNLVEEMKDEDLELAAVGKELYLRSLEQNHCSHNKRKQMCKCPEDKATVAFYCWFQECGQNFNTGFARTRINETLDCIADENNAKRAELEAIEQQIDHWSDFLGLGKEATRGPSLADLSLNEKEGERAKVDFVKSGSGQKKQPSPKETQIWPRSQTRYKSHSQSSNVSNASNDYKLVAKGRASGESQKQEHWPWGVQGRRIQETTTRDLKSDGPVQDKVQGAPTTQGVVVETESVSKKTDNEKWTAYKNASAAEDSKQDSHPVVVVDDQPKTSPTSEPLTETLDGFLKSKESDMQLDPDHHGDKAWGIEPSDRRWLGRGGRSMGRHRFSENRRANDLRGSREEEPRWVEKGADNRGSGKHYRAETGRGRRGRGRGGRSDPGNRDLQGTEEEEKTTAAKRPSSAERDLGGAAAGTSGAAAGTSQKKSRPHRQQDSQSKKSTKNGKFKKNKTRAGRRD